MYQIDFQKPIHVHFIGIGGISMSGLYRRDLQRQSGMECRFGKRDPDAYPRAAAGTVDEKLPDPHQHSRYPWQDHDFHDDFASLA